MEKNSKKQLQRKRTIAHFVDATIKCIDTDGIITLSIRKIADLAGYNSATLYNYFSNHKHLIFFSCINYLHEYLKDLPNYLKETNSPIENYFRVWECFCKHAYKRPEIYEFLFFEDLDNEDFDNSFKIYYDVFPEELTSDIEEYSDMIMERDIFKREFLSLKKACSKLNLPISEEELMDISAMNVLLFRGMLSYRRNSGHKLSPEEAVEKTIFYMKHACKSFQLAC